MTLCCPQRVLTVFAFLAANIYKQRRGSQGSLKFGWRNVMPGKV